MFVAVVDQEALQAAAVETSSSDTDIAAAATSASCDNIVAQLAAGFCNLPQPDCIAAA